MSLAVIMSFGFQQVTDVSAGIAGEFCNPVHGNTGVCKHGDLVSVHVESVRLAMLVDYLVEFGDGFRSFFRNISYFDTGVAEVHVCNLQVRILVGGFDKFSEV